MPGQSHVHRCKYCKVLATRMNRRLENHQRDLRISHAEDRRLGREKLGVVGVRAQGDAPRRRGSSFLLCPSDLRYHETLRSSMRLGEIKSPGYKFGQRAISGHWVKTLKAEDQQTLGDRLMPNLRCRVATPQVSPGIEFAETGDP